MLSVAFFPLFLLHHVQKISQLALADSGAGFVKRIDLWKYLPPIETTGLSLKSDMCFSTLKWTPQTSAGCGPEKPSQSMLMVLTGDVK